MIWTRYGSQIRNVVSSCGVIDNIPGLASDVKMHLLSVEIVDAEKPDCYYSAFRFAETLRAEGGWREIEQAISEVHQVVLSPDQLKEAIKEAL